MCKSIFDEKKVSNSQRKLHFPPLGRLRGANILGGVLFFAFFVTNELKSQIVNIEDTRIRIKDSTNWVGFVDVGGHVNKNVSYVYNLRAAVQVEYQLGRHFGLSISQYNLLKTEGKNVLNDGMQHLRYNYALKPFLKLEIFTQMQYNERISLQKRTLGGLGFRYRLWKQKEGRSYVGIAYMYEHANWLGETETRKDHRMTSYFSVNQLFKDKFKVAATFYFQPLLKNWNNNRISGVATAQYLLTKKLSFKSSLNIHYDNDPRLLVTVPDLTFQWVNGIRFDF
jgi:hypothetical protein